MSSQRQRNEVIRLLDPAKKHHYFRNGFNAGNTWEHERAKLEIAFAHAQQGHEVILEAYFKDGGRTDCLCLDCVTCYEVVVSENEESLLQKEKRYPEELNMEVIRV